MKPCNLCFKYFTREKVPHSFFCFEFGLQRTSLSRLVRTVKIRTLNKEGTGKSIFYLDFDKKRTENRSLGIVVIKAGCHGCDFI